MEVIQGQCRKPSRDVTEKDYDTIDKVYKEMAELCRKPMGLYPAALALAHCQVDHEDPLRFFVFVNGGIVINPEIIDGYQAFNHSEGCYSFVEKPQVKVKRNNIIRVKYKAMGDNGLIEERTERLSGQIACIFQHEIDHFNCVTIFDKHD